MRRSSLTNAADTAFAPERHPRVAIAGLVFSLLFVVAWLLVRGSPAFDADDDELLAYYSDAGSRHATVIAGLYVIPLASIAFIWFMASARERYIRTALREDTILSTAHVVAGALVVTSLLTLAAVELGAVWLAEVGDSIELGGIRSLLALGEASSQIMALRSAAVFIGISVTRSVRSKVFPRSYGVLSMLTALGLMVVYGSYPWVSMLFPAWVTATSVLILLPRRAATTSTGA